MCINEEIWLKLKFRLAIIIGLSFKRPMNVNILYETGHKFLVYIFLQVSLTSESPENMI